MHGKASVKHPDGLLTFPLFIQMFAVTELRTWATAVHPGPLRAQDLFQQSLYIHMWIAMFTGWSGDKEIPAFLLKSKLYWVSCKIWRAEKRGYPNVSEHSWRSVEKTGRRSGNAMCKIKATASLSWDKERNNKWTTNFYTDISWGKETNNEVKILIISNAYIDLSWSTYYSTTIIIILNSYDNSDKIHTVVRFFRCLHLIFPTTCEVGVVLPWRKTICLVVTENNQQAILSTNALRSVTLNRGQFRLSGDIW